MTTTIQDVAVKAGVSTATVSRALRGLPNVAPSTREHILQVARELNYAIDSQASRLASGRSMTVGLVMPLADQWFYSKVAVGAEAVLFEAGYDVLRYNLARLGDQQEVFQRLISSRRVDGLIIVNLALEEDNLTYFEAMDCPIVTVERETDRFPSVCIDNVEAGRKATQHLVNLGHTQIGLISGLSEDMMRFDVPLDRVRGYRSVLEEHDIVMRPELNVPGNFSFAGGAEAMTQLLSIPQPPSAVFALSDEMAIGALKAIRDAGLRVPEDLSVIGFDDQEVAAYLDLTTIRQPVSEFGERAASLLLSWLSERKTEPSHLVLPTRLVLRATTAPLHARAWGRESSQGSGAGTSV